MPDSYNQTAAEQAVAAGNDRWWEVGLPLADRLIQFCKARGAPAEDLVQDVWIRAFNQRVPAKRANTHLLRAVRSRVYSWRRSEERRQQRERWMNT